MDARILNTEIGTTKIAFDCGLVDMVKFISGRRVIVLTEAHIASIYREELADMDTLLIPRGEQVKTLEHIEKTARKLLAKGVDRSDVLVGFGGGSVCDFTGFLASVYKRGVSFGFVPTTLLAQVDASIGGKNGVNLGAFKNMLGLFNTPEFILIHADYCQTLNETEYNNGFAEIIKHGLIADEGFVHFLTENRQQLQHREREYLSKCIKRAAGIKMHIVLHDARETGERKKLNFGHTVGHAIEKKLDISHGEAVGIGMNAAIQVSNRLGLLDDRQAADCSDLIRQFGLPVDNPLSIEEYWPLLMQDKKASGNTIDYIVLESVGKARIRSLDFQQLKSLLS